MHAPAFAKASLAWLDARTLRASARIVALGERAVAFVGRRVPETVIVLVALAIRFSMVLTYHPNNGYDAYDHYAYAQWLAMRKSLPDIMMSRAAYHPPLYYVIEAAFSRLTDAKQTTLGLPSMMFSSATLLLLWFGLERYLPGRRLVRIVALTLAAIFPSAVHLAGMVSNEALNGLLATAALLLAAETLRRQERGGRVIVRASVIGVIVGLQMLTKISAPVTLAAIAGAVGLDFVLRPGTAAERLRRIAPWLMVVAFVAVTSGWYFVRNHHLYGKAVLSGYDGPERLSTPKVETPYFKRRPPAFFFGWSNDPLFHPYAPAGQVPKSYFWPVVVASTFSDYYNYAFVRFPTEPSTITGNGKLLRPLAVALSSASAIGGTLIAATTAVAWFWAFVVSLRRRQAAYLVFLLAPALALLGQLHFVIRYPFDYEGPIKGEYLQFAMAPLFALFGLGVAKMMQRRATWPIGILQCAAVFLVASYTIYARVFAL